MCRPVVVLLLVGCFTNYLVYFGRFVDVWWIDYFRVLEDQFGEYVVVEI